MKKKTERLFILSNGRVAAINKKDGEIIWEIKLRDYLSSSNILPYGQISVEENKVFIGMAGMLLCIDAKDGAMLWKNELKGWGYQFVSMSLSSNNEAQFAGHNADTNAALSTIS